MKRSRSWILSLLLVVFFAALLPISAQSEIRMITHSISVGAAVDTAVTTPVVIPRNMVAYQMVVTIPDTTNGVTFTVALTDGGGKVIKSYAGLADNTGTSPHILRPGVAVGNGYKVSVLPSGVTGNAIAITIVVSYAD